MPNILVGVTGSVSLLVLPSYLVEMRKHFTHLKIIMTHTASKILPPATLSLFAEGIYTPETDSGRNDAGHVALARWADLVVVLPATAHHLFEVANGSASSLLTSTILAHEKRVLFFPNMNSAMWEKKSVQRNVAQLEEDGHRVISPLKREAYEVASKKMRTNHILPSAESVVAILLSEVGVSK